LTLALVSAQDQNIVVGGLLIASVVIPNAADLFARARLGSRLAFRKYAGGRTSGGAR
jgi:hypothetical protein